MQKRDLFGRTTISKRGQITIPAKLRREDSIRSGDSFAVHKVRRGLYSIRRVEHAPNKGLIEWLLRCPVKGYFKPITSEGTDAL
jgi:AbrB family looped-hinge helix DNA binding protein